MKKIIFTSILTQNGILNLEVFFQKIAPEIRKLFTERNVYKIKLISKSEEKQSFSIAIYEFKQYNFELKFLSTDKEVLEEIENSKEIYGFIFVLTDSSEQDFFSFFKSLNLGIPEKYPGPGGLDYFIFENNN